MILGMTVLNAIKMLGTIGRFMIRTMHMRPVPIPVERELRLADRRGRRLEK